VSSDSAVICSKSSCFTAAAVFQRAGEQLGVPLPPPTGVRLPDARVLSKPFTGARAQFPDVTVPIFPVDLDDLVLAILFAVRASQEFHQQWGLVLDLVQFLAVHDDWLALMEYEGPHATRSFGICVSGNVVFDPAQLVTHLAKEGAKDSSLFNHARLVPTVLPICPSAG